MSDRDSTPPPGVILDPPAGSLPAIGEEVSIPAPAAAPRRKVAVVGPRGLEGLADEDGLDAWLKANPGWRRK